MDYDPILLLLGIVIAVSHLLSVKMLAECRTTLDSHLSHLPQSAALMTDYLNQSRDILLDIADVLEEKAGDSGSAGSILAGAAAEGGPPTVASMLTNWVIQSMLMPDAEGESDSGKERIRTIYEHEAEAPPEESDDSPSEAPEQSIQEGAQHP
jgi:hypothetical protein